MIWRSRCRQSLFETMPQRFPELDFYVPQGEGRLARMTEENLAGDSHQTWGYDRAAGVWRIDVFREPHDERDLDLPARREHPAAVRGRHRSHSGRNPVPVARSGSALQGESAPAPKDRADFENVLPRLTDAQRTWLARALRTVHPGHEWLARL